MALKKSRSSEQAREISRLGNIATELKRHAPFTTLGALTGIAIMASIHVASPSYGVQHSIFYSLHPIHVVLSAIVTTALYRRYGGSIWAAIVIGSVGSVGIGTMSDIIMPYLGGSLIGLPMTFEVGFIAHPEIIIPAMLGGVAIGLLRPETRFPHFGHVLVSTWASLSYITTFSGIAIEPVKFPLIFVILFLVVWIPCCTSDIVFPLLFRKGCKCSP
jgi:hypothetical protein